MPTQWMRPRAVSSERCLCNRLAVVAVAMVVFVLDSAAGAEPPRPPSEVRAVDHPWDGGNALDVLFERSPDDPWPATVRGGPPELVVEYVVSRSAEPEGLYAEVARLSAAAATGPDTRVKTTISDVAIAPGIPFHFRVTAINADGEASEFAQSPVDAPGIAARQIFDQRRGWLLIIGLLVTGLVVLFIAVARSGRALYIRPIAGLQAVEEAVGRATEMGRACLFVPGILDMNDIQTIAGLTILSRVAERAAEYDARLEVPTSKSLVMTAARETVQAAYLAAGRPDAYRQDAINYVTDEQFGYVAYLTGSMTRDKPAACFYLGGFFAESLILAETGNSIGAIQVAGTAQAAQLPFFVAACDYTLIGEEFFAASAYLSHDADQLGSLKGQDMAKLLVTTLMVIGVGCLTAGVAASTSNLGWVRSVSSGLLAAGEFIRSTLLSSG